MTTAPVTPIPQTAEGMMPKAEILTALQSAELSPDIVAAIKAWVAEQPGDLVPQEAFMLELAEMAEIENHMAVTLDDLADEIDTLDAETSELENQATVTELQIQKDALAEIEQYADMAEQLVANAGAESTPQATPAAPTPVSAPVTRTTPNVA